MKKRVAAVLCTALLSVALILPSISASAYTLWGVTNGTNNAGFWSGGELFTVDTTTGAVSVKQSYTNLLAFGDIAVNPYGEVYVTYAPDWGGFNKLAKVNTSTWQFDWSMNLPTQMNALTFVGDKLYGHAGGGSLDGLFNFSVLDGTTAPTFIGNSGFLGSDGDLAYNNLTGKLFNIYTPGAVAQFVQLDINSGAGTLLGPFGNTAGGQQYGWGGLEFTPDGELWAGSFWDKNLYQYVAGNPVAVHNLNGKIGGTITGLSHPIPEPAFFQMGALAAMSGLGLLRLRRRS